MIILINFIPNVEWDVYTLSSVSLVIRYIVLKIIFKLEITFGYPLNVYHVCHPGRLDTTIYDFLRCLPTLAVGIERTYIHLALYAIITVLSKVVGCIKRYVIVKTVLYE